VTQGGPAISEPLTHKAFMFKRVGKKWGVYKEVGDSRVPPCPHCGKPYTVKIKVFLDRLIAFGGCTGGFLLTPNDMHLPQLQREFPGQQEFVEKDILPES
jgi:hypothetical protein